MARLSLLGALACLALPAALLAQAPQDRFELGQRLRALERALETTTDAKARARAAAQLEKVTAAFFLGQSDKAGEMLDLARLALKSEDTPPAAVVFAESLSVRPGARLLDASASEIPLTVAAFYKTAAKRPEKVDVRFTLHAGGKALATATVPLADLPFKSALALKGLHEGDHSLRSEVLVGGKVLATSEQTLSVVKDLSDRLASLRKAAASQEHQSAETATLARLVGALKDLAEKKSLETNYPAARLMKEAEALIGSIKDGKRYYTADRAGQFWLTLMSGKSQSPVRLFVPKAAKEGKPLPVVVAMHGAGGSENMFFDGYGDGLAVKLAEERGWFVVATRSALSLFGGGPDPVGVIDALAQLYPVDKQKVFVVGHSMGAGQAVAAAGRAPDRFAAVAALGGGGRVAGGEGVKKVPFFVGIGNKDFALAGAKALDAGLRKAGVKKVTFKSYADVEHLLIVQLALRDVYKFFDAAARGE